MSDNTRPPSPPVVEVISGAESDSELGPHHVSASQTSQRRQSIIEVLSDFSDEEDVEYVGESAPSEPPANFSTDDIEITGHQQLRQPRPRSVPASSRVRDRDWAAERRNTRRRINNNNFGFYQASLLGRDLVILSNSNIPEMLLRHQRTLMLLFHERQNEVSASIMDRINREDEITLDRKTEIENIHNRKALREKQGIAKTEIDGYTNNINPDVNCLCELCGVVLGQGIPLDFQPDPKYDENLAEHAGRCRVNAPWFCLRQCFDIDITLSKRVFAAKCGHVFCGRCIKNMGNRPPAKRGQAQKVVSIVNPHISAPRKCPAAGCGIGFNKGKRTFTELFL